MTDAAEKFCLKWNDFESNISFAFSEIRDSGDLFDVTLSCGEKQIQAHKLILSACSPFFRNIFKHNPHQHPLLYLRGIKYGDLQSILAFMYHGEVNVSQADLSNFLVVAEDLQVKGLTQNSASNKPSPPPSQLKSLLMPPSKHKTILPAPPPLVQCKVSDKPPDISAATAVTDEEEEIVEIPEVKTETGPAAIAEYHQEEEGVDPTEYDDSMMEYGDFTANGDFSGQMLGHEDPGNNKDPGDFMQLLSVDESGEKWLCAMCKKTFKDKSNCRRHVKNLHLSDAPVSCPQCGKSYKNKNSLSSHKCHLLAHKFESNLYDA